VLLLVASIRRGCGDDSFIKPSSARAIKSWWSWTCFVVSTPTEMSGLDSMPQAPRRRVKDESEQPLFLRKAYNMIEKCPPHLGKRTQAYGGHDLRSKTTIMFSLLTSHTFMATGGWTEHGDSFIIKDAKEFQETIIPTVFKHNNFSSFVRQLNFCK
jgi:HSF-type DNA-binding